MIEDGVSNVAYFRLDGGSPKLYTQEYLDKKEKEIERLNNKLEFKETNIKGLENNIEVLEEVIKKYENIIKEAREYIEEHKQKGYRIPMSDDYDFWNELNENEIKELLEILDKAGGE